MPVRLNTAEFDKQVAMRGMTMAEFAYEARISQATISHARAGRPIRHSTLVAIAQALVRLKPLRALAEMDLIAATPAKETP